ncbi:MAG: lipid A deacylase LpxR family protein [Pseudomonadota bacterium]
MLALSKCLCPAALVLAISCPGAAAEPTLQDKVHFFTYENDSHYNTDRFYTNGVQFSVKRSTDTRGRFAKRVSDVMCGWLGCTGDALLTGQANLGQLMYTPRHITWREPQPQDRPWGGLLYYEQQHAFLSPDQRTLTTLGVQVGVSGRLSLAEPAQKLFHRILERPQPQGWDHQIGGALGIMATAEKRSAIDALSAGLWGDVRVHTAGYWRIAAGNIQTYAGVGLAVVAGKNLPLVSPPPPGIGHKMRTGAARKSPAAVACLVPWIQCTAFAAVEARLVAYNLFLDGRLFRDDPSVERRSVVVDMVAGTRFDFPGTRTDSHGPWFLQVKATRRSPEFRSSLPVPRHRVLALTIGTEF